VKVGGRELELELRLVGRDRRRVQVRLKRLSDLQLTLRVSQ